MSITDKILTTGYGGSISADGNDIAFIYPATSTVYDYNAPTNSNLAISSGYYQPQISATSSQIVYTNKVAGIYQAFEKTINSAAPATLISTGTAGAGNSDSYYPYVSANGQVVAFTSAATNLDPRGASFGGNFEAYKYSAGVLTLVSETTDKSQVANATSLVTALSEDGSTVGFYTSATNLVAGLTPSDQSEVYINQNGTLQLVSTASDNKTIADKVSYDISLNQDGSLAAFQSNADNLGTANNGVNQIYVKDLTTGLLTLASSTASGAPATSDALAPELSADGQYVAFESTAANLPGANGQYQVYVKNLLTGAVALASQTATGASGNAESITDVLQLPNGQSFSSDDSKFTFTSFATNLGAAAAGSVLLATDTGPMDTLDAVNGGAALQDTTATAVTFSGTATVGSQFVDVFLDGSKSPIATNVAVDPTTGKWTTAGLNLTAIGIGTHTETAVTQGSGWLSSSISQTFQVKGTPGTTLPTVAVDTDVKFTDASNATFTGTFSETANPVTLITLLDNNQVIGTEAVNGNSGSWSISAALAAGDQNISVIGTDSKGQSSSLTPAPFTLTTGITHSPYSSDEEDLTNGQLVGEVFTGRRGAVYQQDTVTNTPNNHVIDITSGRYFAGQSFNQEVDQYSADYSVFQQQTLDNRDGTHTIQGFGNGQVLTSISNDTFTNDAFHETFVFKPHFGQDLITDFLTTGPGHDTLSVSSHQFASIADVLSRTSDVNGNATIAVTPNDTITLQGVTTAQLQANSGDIRLHH